jgi:hypothetical protein
MTERIRREAAGAARQPQYEVLFRKGIPGRGRGPSPAARHPRRSRHPTLLED